MSPKKTLAQRQKELQALLATPAGREELQALGARYHAAGATIGQGGIRLLPMEEGKGLPVLPFQSYYGLLSRAPTRLSPDLPRSGEGGAFPEAP
jgi:hypothetical protein